MAMPVLARAFHPVHPPLHRPCHSPSVTHLDPVQAPLAAFQILASGFTRPSAAYSSAAAKHIVQLMDITRVLHLPEELGDLARIIGEHRISPTELREYIELVTPRRSMYEKPTTASHSRRVSSPDAQSKA
ncbi:hypothetical protein FS749_005045 [Ceratobasidium sp. UAMH 11750]|nr:hypothetical protein FS749_005045 [Ceratobasidium sp. UAMH 11750]